MQARGGDGVSAVGDFLSSSEPSWSDSPLSHHCPILELWGLFASAQGGQVGHQCIVNAASVMCCLQFPFCQRLSPGVLPKPLQCKDRCLAPPTALHSITLPSRQLLPFLLLLSQPPGPHHGTSYRPVSCPFSKYLRNNEAVINFFSF